jgi:hypothetical protein
MKLSTSSGNTVSVDAGHGKRLRPIWQRDPDTADLKELALWLFRIRRPELNLRQRCATAEDELQAWRSHAHDLRRKLQASEIHALELEEQVGNQKALIRRSVKYAETFQRELKELKGSPTPGREEPVEIHPEPLPRSKDPDYPRYIEHPIDGERCIVHNGTDAQKVVTRWKTTLEAAIAAAAGHHSLALQLHERSDAEPAPPRNWLATFVMRGIAAVWKT